MLKNSYQVSSLRNKVQLAHKTDENALTQPFTDENFREIVKEVVAELGQRGRQVTLTSKPVYYS